MTLTRLREVRTQQLAERRSGMTGSYGSSYGWMDPSAIPPPNMGSMMRAGVSVNSHTALQVDVVFTSLRVISNAIIKMGQPRAYTEALTDDFEPYRVGLAVQPQILTRTFGPKVWNYDGKRRTIISLALFGEAFWLTLLRDRNGYPSVIEVLHPAFMETKITKSGPGAGSVEYWYGSGAHKTQLADEDITHIPFVALPGAARGLSSIEYAGVNYALALAALEYGQRWFAQGASPSFILSTEQKLGTPEIERIARKFLVDHAGLTNAHLPLVVDSGLKVDKISATPDESQFIGTLEYSRNCIAAWFGLPSHLVGGVADKGNMWGRSMQEQGFQMENFTISGYVVPLEEAYSSFLPAGQFAAFDESQIQRADSSALAALITATRTTGVETKNEIRVHNLKRRTLPGGDDLGSPLNSNTSPPVGTVLGDELAKEEGQPPPPAAPVGEDQ